MTTSSTNIPTDHATRAEFWFDIADRIRERAEPNSGDAHDGALLAAHVHASLAIAHEQRTANLIAYLAIAVARGGRDDATHALQDDIESRLGLGEPA